jgi:hypothetical protein
MKPNPIKTLAALALIVLVTSTTTLFYSAHAAPLGTAFTYQGRLVDNGSPANGNYDLRFTLYDALSGGSTIGVPIANAPTAVSNGLFTVTLDFGGGIFIGEARWLEMGVRTNDSVLAYTLLTPRQELTPTPYALYAPSAGAAATAGTATTANSVASGSINNTALAVGAVNSSSIADGSIAANDLSAALWPIIAFLDHNQTFTGANIFDRGYDGPGRLIVQGDSAVDTSPFTGLSFQYNNVSGEGAIMSSYNDGYASLSFYTKAGPGYPIAKKMIIDRYGNVAVDQGNYNNGILNNSTTSGAGLTFGFFSGAGIASKRTAGGNQNGLDFYTGSTNRMSIANTGNVGIGTTTPASPVDILGGRWDLSSSEGDFRIGDPTYRLKIGVATAGGGAGDTRIRAQGGTSRIMLGSGTYDVLTVLGTNVGIGTVTPSSSLHVVGDTRITGVTRAGSETGTAQPPDKGIITRRVLSTLSGAGSVVARTDTLTLERDGSSGGLRIVNVASPGHITIAFTGLTSVGATVNFVTSLNPAAAGTNTVFTDAQFVVSLRGSFGDSYYPHHMTEVSLTRYPTDNYWTGTLTSTFNQ